METHSSTFAWKIPWTEEPGRVQSTGSLKSDTIERLHFDFSLSCIGEGNRNSLQCSCLDNPRDRGTWWAAIYGVAQSRTWLKWLSSSSSSRVFCKINKQWVSILITFLIFLTFILYWYIANYDSCDSFRWADKVVGHNFQELNQKWVYEEKLNCQYSS